MFRRPNLHLGKLHLYLLHTLFKMTLLLWSWLSFHDEGKHTYLSRFCSYFPCAWIASLFKVCRTFFVNIKRNMLPNVLQQAIWIEELAFRAQQIGYSTSYCRSWTLSRTFWRSQVLLFSQHHRNTHFSSWAYSPAPLSNAHNTTCIGWDGRGGFSRLRWHYESVPFN